MDIPKGFVLYNWLPNFCATPPAPQRLTTRWVLARRVDASLTLSLSSGRPHSIAAWVFSFPVADPPTSVPPTISAWCLLPCPSPLRGPALAVPSAAPSPSLVPRSPKLFFWKDPGLSSILVPENSREGLSVSSRTYPQISGMLELTRHH